MYRFSAPSCAMPLAKSYPVEFIIFDHTCPPDLLNFARNTSWLTLDCPLTIPEVLPKR